MATPSTSQDDCQNFVIELVQAVDKYQGIVDQMVVMVGQLTQATDEIDLQKRNYPSLASIGPRCEDCLNRAFVLNDKSYTLRDKHEKLASLFNQPNLPIPAIRTLVYELNGMSSEFFTAVIGLQSAIKWVQDEVEALADRRHQVREEPWWRKALGFLRDGLAIAGGFLVLIPEPHCQIVGNGCALGAVAAGFVHARTESYTRSGPGPSLTMITAALGNARESAEVVCALEMGLDQTILRALCLIDNEDMRNEASRSRRAADTIPIHKHATNTIPTHRRAVNTTRMPVPVPYRWERN